MADVPALMLWRVAWFFGWRNFLLGLVVNYQVGVFLGNLARGFVSALFISSRFLEVGLTLLLLVLLFVPVVGLWLWVERRIITRMLSVDHGKFRLSFVRNSGTDLGTSRLSAIETIKIWWLFGWRAMILGGMAGGVLGFLLIPRDTWPWMTVHYVLPFFAFPWGVSALLRKQFEGFRVTARPAN